MSAATGCQVVYAITLLVLGAERLVQHIGDFLEDIRRNILFLLGVQEVDADGPVSQWEAWDTAIGVRTGLTLENDPEAPSTLQQAHRGASVRERARRYAYMMR
jgi:hypothetical protein